MVLVSRDHCTAVVERKLCAVVVEYTTVVVVVVWTHRLAPDEAGRVSAVECYTLAAVAVVVVVVVGCFVFSC